MKFFKHNGNIPKGAMLKKIILFSLPLVVMGILQTLYNAADLVVVGYFDGNIALAAVGNTGALTNLIVGLFMGLSVGAGVCVAQHVGAKEYDEVNKVVHTSVLASLILGVIVSIVGIILAPRMLAAMDTPDSVIRFSTLYLRIILCGVPASMLFNYCAAILRSTGDTKHPMVFLSVSGLVNVGLNLIFVILLHMGVAGVAVATISSQYLSAAMIVVFMCRSNSYIKLSFRKLGIDRRKLAKILYIGIPSGLQGVLFSFSNVLIQSSINGFGDIVMAANSAAANLEQFVYISMNAVYHASLTFVGQNIGAKTYSRIRSVLVNCVVVVTAIGLGMAGIVYLLRYPLLNLYAPGNPEVAQAAISRMSVILPTYFLCGIMEVFCGALRGMGKSVTAMVVSLVGACGIRILWIKTIFVLFPTITNIYISYPVSWAITAATHMIFCIVFLHRLMKKGARNSSSGELSTVGNV